MELDPEARRVLSLAQEARTPSDEDRARVEKRLALALGAAAIAAPTAAAVAAPAAVAAKSAAGAGMAKGASGLVALKWWLGGVALLAAAAGGYVASSQPGPASRTPAPMAPARAALPEPLAQPEPQPEPPSAPAVLEPSPPAPADAQPAAAPTSQARRRARGADDRLAAELTLLHRAQTAWRAGDARTAHTLLREHTQRFPRSELGLERDALQVLTLCELGQKARARQLAHKLLARAPSSPLRASIEQSCALR